MKKKTHSETVMFMLRLFVTFSHLAICFVSVDTF